MKKTLSLFMVAASISLASAQPVSTPSWTNAFKAVAEIEDANKTAPVAITGNGNVYAAGQFNQMIATDEIFLEPVAQDSYLIKYDKAGKVLWNISLAGAATIKAVVADAEENVYITGTLADQVTFNTTSGEPIVLEGKKMSDAFTETQDFSFIAKYDANGVLVDAKTITAEDHPDIAASGLMYFSAGGQVEVSRLALNGDKVYLSAFYAGKAHFGDLERQASLVVVSGFLLDDVQHAALVSFSADDLNHAELVAEMRPTAAMGSEVAFNTSSFDFALDGDAVYVGAVGLGDLTLETPDGEQEFNFAVEAGGVNEYGHVIARIENGQIQAETYTAPATATTNKKTIDDLMVVNDVLYVGGVFNDTLAYDNTVFSTNKTDLYVAALDKHSLELQATWVSGYDEEENNVNQEVFANMLMADNIIYLNGYREQISDRVLLNGLSYTIADGNISGGSREGMITSMDANNHSMVLAGLDKDGQNTVAYYADVLSSIEGVKGYVTLSAQRVGDTFYFAEPKDITVYDLQGRALQQEYAATSVSLENLSQGIYILSDGKQSLKVLK